MLFYNRIIVLKSISRIKARHKDNHYLYSTVPNEKATALMVVHSYNEDKPEMNDINAKIANVLRELGGEVRNGDEWLISSKNIKMSYVETIINR